MIDPATFGFDPVVIDIGGEGRYPNAINVNPATNGSYPPYEGKIPNRVDSFGEKLPFPDNSVDGIVIESGPINPDVIQEVVRVLKPGGSVRLVTPLPEAEKLHESVIEALGGAATQRPVQMGQPGLPLFPGLETVITAPRPGS